MSDAVSKELESIYISSSKRNAPLRCCSHNNSPLNARTRPALELHRKGEPICADSTLTKSEILADMNGSGHLTQRFK